MTNMDELGIRYTYYRADDIDPDVLEDLLYLHGKDLSYEAAVEQEIAEQRAAWEERCETASVIAQEEGEPAPTFDDFDPIIDDFDPQIEEPIIEGTHEGVHYRTSWLGGALHVWVFKSPMIEHFLLCSPCVPGACDGSNRTSRENGYPGYALPPHWLAMEPGEFRSFADRIGEFE